MGYVRAYIGDRLSSRPAMGCVWVGICFCRQTFISFSALLVINGFAADASRPKDFLALLIA